MFVNIWIDSIYFWYLRELERPRNVQRTTHAHSARTRENIINQNKTQYYLLSSNDMKRDLKIKLLLSSTRSVVLRARQEMSEATGYFSQMYKFYTKNGLDTWGKRSVGKYIRATTNWNVASGTPTSFVQPQHFV